MKPSTALVNVLEGCIDDEQTLRLEAEFVRSPVRRTLLLGLAQERSEFIDRLNDLAKPQHLAKHAPGGSRESSNAARRFLSGRNDGDAILHCRQSRDRTEALYERAIAMNADESPLRSLLLTQHVRLGTERSELLEAQF